MCMHMCCKIEFDFVHACVDLGGFEGEGETCQFRFKVSCVGKSLRILAFKVTLWHPSEGSRTVLKVLAPFSRF